MPDKKKNWPYVSNNWIYDQVPGPKYRTGESAEDWQAEFYPFYKQYRATVGLEGKRSDEEWGRGTKIKSPTSDNIYVVTARHWTPVWGGKPFRLENLRGKELSYEPVLNSPKDDVAIRRVRYPEEVTQSLKIAKDVGKGDEVFLAGNDVRYHPSQEEEKPMLKFIPESKKNAPWIWMMPVKGEAETEKGDIIVNFSPGSEEGFYPLMRGHSGSAVVNSEGEVVGIASALKSSPVGGETFQSYISKTNPKRLEMLLKGADQVSEGELEDTLRSKFEQLPEEIQNADDPALKIINDMGKFNEDEIKKISDTVQFWFSVEKFSPMVLRWPDDDRKDDFQSYKDSYKERVEDKYGEEYLPEDTIENYLKRFEEKTRPTSKRNVAI